MVVLNVHFPPAVTRMSCGVSIVMDHFGIAREQTARTLAIDFEIPLTSGCGEIACFSGPSGSGKSSLLRATVDELRRDQHNSVLTLEEIELGEESVIDGFPGLSIERAVEILSQCGLGEARILLQTPRELSDGQRYRLRLARAIVCHPTWLVADEFTAVLDRTLARVIAWNVRKMSRRTGIGVLIATTHQDILHDLKPDWQIVCALDEPPRLKRAGARWNGAGECQQLRNESALPANFNLRPAISRTGRTSLGGIIEAMTSD